MFRFLIVSFAVLSAGPAHADGWTHCGGVAGLACPDGMACVDRLDDGCNAACGGADCLGICVYPDPSPRSPEPCAGARELTCPDVDHICVDAPKDACVAECGDADCAGECAFISNPDPSCRLDADCPAGEVCVAGRDGRECIAR